VYLSAGAEVTARFSTISKKIICIAKILEDRGLSLLSSLIKNVQQLEKEKLVLISSEQLEKIGKLIPAMMKHLGITPDLFDISGRMSDIEEKISSVMENIQCEKCELDS